MRWVWDVQRPEQAPTSRLGLEVRVLPVRGLNVAARIMAETWEGYITREDAVRFLQEADGKGKLLPFVAYTDGRPVASALVVVHGKSAELYGGVHVLPGHRRRGFGTAMLREVMRQLAGQGVSRLYVARQVTHPPTEDDQAAAALYDRAGGVRQKPVVEVVYTPQCPWCADWLAGFREELKGLDVDFQSYNLWDDPEPAWELLRGAGLATRGATPMLLRNVYAQAFVDGEAVGDGVPLEPGRLSRTAMVATGDRAARRGESLARMGADTAGVTDARPAAPLAGGTPYGRRLPRTGEVALGLSGLSREALTVPVPGDAFDLCLRRHPSGINPRPGAEDEGSGVKRRWLEGLRLPGGFYGVRALRGEQVVGIMEIYPREVSARAGFVTGNWEAPGGVFTITCLEVAREEPRQPVMEFLLEGLIDDFAARCDDQTPPVYIEAFGVYGSLAGSNPYWLFEKYGFTRHEERQPGVSAILGRPLRIL